jgi:hypothetical protein
MKILRLFILLLTSYILAFGLVVMANGFMILSFARFAGTAALITPIIFILLIILNRFYPLPELYCPLRERRKEALTVLLAALALALLLVPLEAITARYLITVIVVSLTLFVWSVFALLPYINGVDGYLDKIYIFISLIFGLLGISLFLYMALQARMYGDDFCYHINVLENGYLPTVIDFYLTWSGRFSSNFVLFAASGFRWASLIQIALIIISVSVCAYLLTPFSDHKKKRLLWSAACGALIPFLVFSLTPDPYKTLFWLVSSAALLPVLILQPAYLLLVWFTFQGGQTRPGSYSVLGFTLSFLITTTHEVATLPLLALNASLVLAAFLIRKDNLDVKLIIWAAFTGAFAGALVTVLAPGNYGRHSVQAYPPPPDIYTLVQTNTTFFVNFMKEVLAGPGWLALIGVFILAYLGWMERTGRFITLGIVALLTAGMVWLSFIPGTYVAQVPIHPRSQFIPTIWLVIGTFCGGLLSPRIKSRYIYLSLLSIFLLLSAFNYQKLNLSTYGMVDPIRTYARDWDERHSLMLSSRLQPERIEVPWDEFEQKMDCIIHYYDIVRDN